MLRNTDKFLCFGERAGNTNTSLRYNVYVTATSF